MATDIATFINEHNAKFESTFNYDKCFLCSIQLTKENKTREHVFPQWMIRRFDLSSQRLHLENGTKIPYSRLTIPCCDICNNERLSSVEQQVTAAFSKGIEAVKNLDRKVLFLWLSKIFYGLVFRGADLAADLRDPVKGKLNKPERLKQFQAHHLILQGALGAVDWPETLDFASIFIFDCQVPNERKKRFDYLDAREFPFLAMRVGSVGIVAALQDLGAMEKLHIPVFEAAKQQTLHPMQWIQVAALGLYICSLNTTSTRFLSVEQDSPVQLIPLAPLDSSASCFDEFVPEEYASVFALILGQPASDILSPDGGVTDIVGQDNDLVKFDVDTNETVVLKHSPLLMPGHSN